MICAHAWVCVSAMCIRKDIRRDVEIARERKRVRNRKEQRESSVFKHFGTLSSNVILPAFSQTADLLEGL